MPSAKQKPRSGPATKPSTPTSYKDAGVNIDEGDRAVARIKRLAKSTFSPNVLTGIGSFGAAFSLRNWRKPVLISSADGVGTKLKVAFMANKHDTVGEDLVNHCVNDIMVQGATPLFFLDYFATGILSASTTADVVSGIARGCKANGCALIGGETAEMPGLYIPGEYDLAGFIVGALEEGKLLTGSAIKPGDLLLGLPSTGLHTNGYSLARKLFFEIANTSVDTYLPELGCTVGEELLKVHRSYAKPMAALRDAGLLKGAAHITGGGITDNLPRILPKVTAAEIHTSSWIVPPVFELLRAIGDVPVDDWRRTFNLGIGMILAVDAKKATAAEALLRKVRSPFYRLGVVTAAKPKAPQVRYV
jgi:phosphoribosylformylglycinamidine cyclo-ligase